MKGYPKGKQRRKLQAMVMRVERILAGQLDPEVRALVERGEFALRRALRKWRDVRE